MVFSLLHLANSYYLMKELGYFYNLDDKRKEFSKLKNKVCKSNNKIKDLSPFKFLKFLVGRVENNTKEQIYVYKEITTLIDYDYYLETFKMRKEHYEIMFYIFNKALNFEFLSPYLKYKLIKLKNRAIKKQNKDIYLTIIAFIYQ